MPSVFTRLWVAHFCSWMGLMCVILYYTEFFGEIMYQGMVKILIFTWFLLKWSGQKVKVLFLPIKGDPNAEKGSIDRQNYEEGLRMGSLGLFTQNIIAMFSSFYIDALILKFGKRNVFLLSTVSIIVSHVLCKLVNRTVFYVFVFGSS